MQAWLWSGAALSLALAGGAAWMDRRRAGLEGMARVGWMPWSGVTVALLFAAVACLLLALRG